LFRHHLAGCLVLDEASRMNLPKAVMAALPLIRYSRRGRSVTRKSVSRTILRNAPENWGWFAGITCLETASAEILAQLSERKMPHLGDEQRAATLYAAGQMSSGE
jgi:hypothetical protein